jgi:hypothetical protein
MILDREDRQFLVPHPLRRTVIEIDLGQFDFFSVQGIGIHTKPVILGSDHDPSGPKIFDGLIGSSMAEFQLEGPSSHGEPQELVAQTDSEDRFLTDEMTDCLDDVGNTLWIARTV